MRNRDIPLPNNSGKVRVEITTKNGKDCLSLTGGIYEPGMPHIDRHLISCGQVKDRLRGEYPNNEAVTRLAALWDRWHLNDMRAGCEHQRALGWDKEPIDPSRPTTAYGRFGRNSVNSWNLKAWLPANLGGYLGRPCPECGYRCGTAWLHEDLPPEVAEELGAIDLQPNT